MNATLVGVGTLECVSPPMPPVTGLVSIETSIDGFLFFGSASFYYYLAAIPISGIAPETVPRREGGILTATLSPALSAAAPELTNRMAFLCLAGDALSSTGTFAPPNLVRRQLVQNGATPPLGHLPMAHHLIL